MKLPNGADARVDPWKVRDYLLAEDHPTGGAKAHFFGGLGFDPGLPMALISALGEIARSGEVQAIYATAFGTKYIIDGMITGPKGARAGVRTVWITESDLAPRLVTAYPSGEIEREGDDEGA